MHFGTPTEHMKRTYTAVLKVKRTLRTLLMYKKIYSDNHIAFNIYSYVQHKTVNYKCAQKGHIALASLVVPEGTLGSRIDAVARLALWELGLDYNHGTGHGVGSYLNVHEGPQGIGFRKRENEVVS